MWILGAARQAILEAQCAIWPWGPSSQTALRGNFQPSLTPPEGLAKAMLRVFRALEIPTWWVCPQQGLRQDLGLWIPGVVSPGLSTVTVKSLGIS